MYVLWDAVNVRNTHLRLWIFPVSHFLVILHWSVTLVYFIFCDNYSGIDTSFFFPDTIPMHIYFQSFSNSVFLCVCLSCLLTFSLCVVLPERLCDGPSSPCRPQATSCWAPPATLSSCWRRRREQRRAWRCHRRAGSGSCRACCWARYPIDDGLKAHDGRAKTHTEETGGICLFMSQCAVQTFQTVSSHSHL